MSDASYINDYSGQHVAEHFQELWAERTDCIRFRVVVNDAVCRPWENMPEVQPPTFAALVQYLQGVCAIDPRPLEVAGMFDNGRGGSYLSYGERKQFWLPTPLTADDVAQMETWRRIPESMTCPVCGGELSVFDEYTMGYAPEAYKAAFCEPCDLRFTRHSKMSRLAIDLEAAISKARKRRLALGT